MFADESRCIRVDPITYGEVEDSELRVTNGCTYCTGVYCTNLGKEVGSEEVVRGFQEQFTEGELTGPEADITSGYSRITTGFDCEHEDVYHAAGWKRT